MQITVAQETFPLAQEFTISRGSKRAADVVVVTVTDGAHQGRGEATPYARYGESLPGVMAQIATLGDDIPGRVALQDALPAGAARNAVDCALWDLAALQAGRRVWQLAGLAPPRPVVTAYTLSLGPPDVMGLDAARHAHRPILKIKLGTEDDIPRVEAVRAAAPRSRLIIDANEGWSAALYTDIAPHLARLGVELIEQPLAAGADDALLGLPRPVPICADESCHDRASLAGLAGKYDMINIKLDKAGGLTEALALRDAARAQGFGIMVGCMVASSLAMAPAVLVAQGARVADLDGPLLLADDRRHGLHYDNGHVHPPEAALWG